jgi:hypothetical protein
MRAKLNSNQIKVIAIAAMTADHVAWLLFPGYSKELLPLLLHIVGRLTCPIMCYFVAEGYHHTKNINQYTARLFLFALISHIPYMLASDGYVDAGSLIPFYYGDVLNQTGVMWSLAWGLVMLRVADSERIKGALKALVIVLICVIAFPSDWSCIASLCVLAFGTNRGNFKAQMLWMVFYVAIYATVYFFALDPVYGILQMGVVSAIPVLATYNGERGKSPRVNRWMKWTFYIYYPLHLLIIGLIRIL